MAEQFDAVAIIVTDDGDASSTVFNLLFACILRLQDWIRMYVRIKDQCFHFRISSSLDGYPKSGQTKMKIKKENDKQNIG